MTKSTKDIQVIAKRLALRIGLGVLGLLLILAIGGGIWLRDSLYCAGNTQFFEANRVETFRAMDRALPYRDVQAGPSVLGG